jgi:hypothetical protein
MINYFLLWLLFENALTKLLRAIHSLFMLLIDQHQYLLTSLKGQYT